MEMSKILEHFVPFNEVFYKSCFYNAFFPVVKHFNKDIVPFLVNDVITYSYDQKSKAGLDIMFIEVKNIEEVSQDIGIKMNCKTIQPNVLESIKKSISKAKPVILLIDCFYEEIRTDTFHKTHLPHNLLIYGYDDEKKVCHVIEHTHREQLNYEKRTLSYECIEEAHHRFSEHLTKKEHMPFYVELSLEESIEKEPREDLGQYRRIFARNMLFNKEEILFNLRCLHDYKEMFQLYTMDESALLSDAQIVLMNLNNIINVKNAEKFKLSQILSNEAPEQKLLDQIIHQWTIIRGILAKYIYSSRYKQKDFMLAMSKLETIYQLECEYYNALFSTLQSYE